MPRRKLIETMHKAFGKKPGTTCRDCVHLVQHQQSKRWYKCDLTTPGGATTDWSPLWPACGKFEARTDDR